jgi:hypothetical protein
MVLKQQEPQQQVHQQGYSLNNRKLNDRGFVKSSKTLIGNKNAAEARTKTHKDTDNFLCHGMMELVKHSN